MKQVIQSFRTGELSVADVPAPSVRARGVLVRTVVSLVSTGTERMVAEFAEKSLWQKAQARPDLVRQVVDKVKRDGVLSTIDSVRNRLDQPLALGYSSAGVVIDVGTDALSFAIGDRVACAGGGYASHAEVVYVPRNLVEKLPDGVSFEAAAFASVGAIAMQGIRQGEVAIGHRVAVIGLGLLGQLSVQMLKAAGCQVIGVDINPKRAALAHKLGADTATTSAADMTTTVQQLTGGKGVDVVLITADTRSNEPIELAGELARDRAVVVAVGAVGMEIPRKVYYDKELDFKFSRSYGPGRYDPDYEEKGNDYPYGYVRFTEQRNMEAFIQLVAQSKVDVQPLITHRFPIEEAPRAYDVITNKAGEPFLGVLITYPEHPDLSRKITVEPTRAAGQQSTTAQADGDAATRPVVGVLGAGNFVNATLLPVIKSVGGVELFSIASISGLTARHSASKFGFRYCASDESEVLDDSRINTVIVATRHNLHARQVIAALGQCKHVFCEKPLCLKEEELSGIIAAYCTSQAGSPKPSLMVGYNRRFAPFIVELKEAARRIQEPLLIYTRANAGFIPPNHWTQDPTQGGGRLLGEACHFIDLLIFLTGDVPTHVVTHALPNAGKYAHDNLSIELRFANGSIGHVIYSANGDRSFGKEYLEVFGGGLSASLDDYRSLKICRQGKTVEWTARLRPDKGHRAEWQAFMAHLNGRAGAPISFEEIVVSTRTTLAAQRSLLEAAPVALPLSSGVD